MHDHSRRFIDHGERSVFVNYFERDVFRREIFDGKLGQFDFDFIGGAKFIRGFYLTAVDRRVAVVNQFLQTRARPAFDFFRQICVETFADIFRLNLKTEV